MWSNMTKVTVQPKKEEKKDVAPSQQDSTADLPFSGYVHLPDEEEEADTETDNMFLLLEQIKACKETKGLSDEDRRANAEHIMHKLASLMDLGSDDEEANRDYGDE